MDLFSFQARLKAIQNNNRETKIFNEVPPWKWETCLLWKV